MEQSEKIWLDGRLVDWSQAQTHILTHTLHYGGGVFEGIRCYKTAKGPAVFRLKEHIERLFYSASVLEMDVPFSKQQIEEAVARTIKANGLEECYVRPIIFFGDKMGLNPIGAPLHVAIAAWPWGAYLGGKEAVDVKISKYIRMHPGSADVKAKICGYYANSILASLEAHKGNYDEAIFLDHEGFVAEGPGENVFMVKKGGLVTPSAENILAGITRDAVIKIAQEMGIAVEERKISKEELKSAEEAFFSGTAVEICPIGRIDETVINQGRVGEITKKIKENFEKIVRGNTPSDWLTFVR
ncbi:MAG: branched-chain amino acid transaminase [Candidatus Pacebacteria bacterium]|nr:branched-chain amino acid transaminase [Candidatus Paceibacterota bacterium]